MHLFAKNRKTWVKGEKIERRDPVMDPALQEKLRNTISSPFKRVHKRRIHLGTHYKTGRIICQI